MQPDPTTRASTLAFLSIVSWPEGMSEQDQIAMLAAATGLDAPSLRLRVKYITPCVIARLDQQTAQHAVNVITQHGGAAFAPTMDDLTALGPTRKIRDLRLEPTGLALDIWRGSTVTLDPAEIFVLVRARLSEVHTKYPESNELARTLSHGMAGFAFGFGGSYGIAASLYATSLMANTEPNRELHTSCKLDIHTRDGHVYQIDADKFGFEILGDQRAASDNINIDLMCELLAQLSPNAAVDPYFSYWRPAPGAEKFRIPQMHLNNDDPCFAFYSRWAALMYHHLLSQ